MAKRTRKVGTSRYRPSDKFKKTLLGGGALVVLVGLNAPAAYSFAAEKYHAYKIAQPGYKRQYGSWAMLDVPKRFRTNAIHAALLHSGKVLIIAGSGNNQKKFDEGSFDTILWNPADDSFKKIPTPEDFFCAYHSQLPDGSTTGGGRHRALRGPRRRGQPGGRRDARQEREPGPGPHVQEGHPLPLPVGRRVRQHLRRQGPQGEEGVQGRLRQERPDAPLADQDHPR